jgi:hypothetical protein
MAPVENTVLSEVAQDRVVVAFGKLADRPERRVSDSRTLKENASELAQLTWKALDETKRQGLWGIALFFA